MHDWKPIGTYRLDPLPIKAIPPIPTVTFVPTKERKSILSYLPIVTEPVKEHVFNRNRWRL